MAVHKGRFSGSGLVTRLAARSKETGVIGLRLFVRPRSGDSPGSSQGHSTETAVPSPAGLSGAVAAAPATAAFCCCSTARREPDIHISRASKDQHGADLQSGGAASLAATSGRRRSPSQYSSLQ